MSGNKAWGAEPVPSPATGRITLSESVGIHGQPVAVDEASRFALTDLLALKGKEQRNAAAVLLDAGLSPASPRSILIVGLHGGVGVSTLAAQVASVWFDRAVRGVVLDAANQVFAGLADRFVADELLGAPSWDEFDGLDESAIVEQFASASAAGSGNVVVSGTQVAPSQVAQVAQSVLVSWPLVVIDGGNDPRRAISLIDTVRPDLLVVAMRPSVSEIRTAGDWLAAVAGQTGFDVGRHAVGAVIEMPSMRTSQVAAAVAAIWNVAAGTVSAAYVPRLAVRTTPVSRAGAPEGVRLLAGALVVANSSQGAPNDSAP